MRHGRTCSGRKVTQASWRPTRTGCVTRRKGSWWQNKRVSVGVAAGPAVVFVPSPQSMTRPRMPFQSQPGASSIWTQSPASIRAASTWWYARRKNPVGCSVAPREGEKGDQSEGEAAEAEWSHEAPTGARRVLYFF
jgi:hypothetical protein